MIVTPYDTVEGSRSYQYEHIYESKNLDTCLGCPWMKHLYESEMLSCLTKSIRGDMIYMIKTISSLWHGTQSYVRNAENELTYVPEEYDG